MSRLIGVDMATLSIRYWPRHYDGPDALGARLDRDRENAKRAVRVLAACDTLPAARALYRELHRAGTLMPNRSNCRAVFADDLIAREARTVTA